MKLKQIGYVFSILFFYIILLWPTMSCNHSARNQPDETQKRKDVIQQKPGSSFTDSIFIDIPSAVFYNPDSIQQERIKAITDSSVFKSTMHEFFYQQRNAHIVLKKYYPAIKIIEVKNARYLIFKMANGQKEKIDLDLKSDACGLFIFDGHKPPQVVDMTNIDSQLGFYLSKKPE